MEREFYLDLAARGLRMPIGTDLVLHEEADPEAIRVHGERLGAVVVETARRFKTPLAVPLMDLTIEKTALLEMLDVPSAQIPMYHFDAAPGDDVFDRFEARSPRHRSARLDATIAAVRHVTQHDELVPLAMAIGPFSLMVRLLADPITAVYHAGRGAPSAGNPAVVMLERTLELTTRVVLWSLERQIAAGARAVFICEPAASTAYISPRQLATGVDILERLVLRNLRRVKALLDAHEVDLILHDCGELTPDFIRGFVPLDPAILSLGSSRNLWEDAALVPQTTVLFGNLPTKKFYSDADISLPAACRMAAEMIEKMRATGHPFILGSECDVLSVPGAHELIFEKVEACMAVNAE